MFKVGENISILGRGVEDIKKTQIRCMKKKNTMFEKKNILLGINSRLYRIEEILPIYQEQKLSKIKHREKKTKKRTKQTKKKASLNGGAISSK